MLEQAGFVDVRIGEPVDTFGGAGGEKNARAYEVFGYAFLARKPRREPAVASQAAGRRSRLSG